MVKLTGTFSKLKKVKTLVIGDFMLDRYTYGSVKRISPEAPVSILKVEDEKMLPGGAGNVVLNLLSLGSEVIAIGRIGDDIHGDILKVAFDVTGNSMDINIDSVGEPVAQAILDYTGNTDSTFYPRVAMTDNAGSALDVSDTEGGDVAVYGYYSVFGRLTLTLASAVATETVTATVTYRD